MNSINYVLKPNIVINDIPKIIKVIKPQIEFDDNILCDYLNSNILLFKDNNYPNFNKISLLKNTIIDIFCDTYYIDNTSDMVVITLLNKPELLLKLNIEKIFRLNKYIIIEFNDNSIIDIKKIIRGQINLSNDYEINLYNYIFNNILTYMPDYDWDEDRYSDLCEDIILNFKNDISYINKIINSDINCEIKFKYFIHCRNNNIINLIDLLNNINNTIIDIKDNSINNILIKHIIYDYYHIVLRDL